MVTTNDEAEIESTGLLSLPLELRLHVYSYIAPFIPLTINVHENSRRKIKVDDNTKAVLALSQTCQTINQDLADLSDEILKATVSIGQRPWYWSRLDEENMCVQEESHDNLSRLLRRMRSVELFLWIDLDQLDYDAEERARKENKKLTIFEDIINLLSSSNQLETFSCYGHVLSELGTHSSLTDSTVGKQLAALQDRIDAETGLRDRSCMDRELEHAKGAVPLLRLGVEDARLLEASVGYMWPHLLQREVEDMRLWRRSININCGNVYADEGFSAPRMIHRSKLGGKQD